MIKIGLTGNIGSGKSVTAHIFEILGIPVYHADEKAKNILCKKEVTGEIKKLFGPGILDDKGMPDRKKIASIVFSDSKKLSALNKIIHPAVLADFNEWMNRISLSPYVIMESAILYETGYFKMFDGIIVVTATGKIRMERTMKRDGSSREEVKQGCRTRCQRDPLKKKPIMLLSTTIKDLSFPRS
jgi:dephospho-CoA kinase